MCLCNLLPEENWWRNALQSPLLVTSPQAHCKCLNASAPVEALQQYTKLQLMLGTRRSAWNAYLIFSLKIYHHLVQLALWCENDTVATGHPNPQIMGNSATAAEGILQLMEDNSPALSLWRWPNPSCHLMVTFTIVPLSHKPQAFRGTSRAVKRGVKKMTCSSLTGQKTQVHMRKCKNGYSGLGRTNLRSYMRVSHMLP